MTPDEAKQAIEMIEQAGDKHDARLYNIVERQLDASDRAIAQAAQLKLISENDGLADVFAQLQEAAAAAADPT